MLRARSQGALLRFPHLSVSVSVSNIPDEKPDRRQINNPLHGLTLEVIVTRLVNHYGFQRLGELIPLNCFRINASIRSSLKYLRMTPKARARVEELYLYTFESR